MIWWLENPTRARTERQGVANLAERVAWLKGVRWHLSNGAALAVDFEIEHDGDSVPLTMTYAEFHPNSPPIVLPRDGSRLSNHQYGAGGNLCLEYRADNWETSITGAMMIESAHRLIAGERDVEGPELPSAHAVSLGQSVRGSYFRFLLTRQMEERLKAIAPGQSFEIGIAEKYYADTFTVTIIETDGVTDGRAWPAGIRETTKRGQAIRLPEGTAMPAATQAGIADLLGALGLGALREAALAASGEMDLVLASATETAHFYAYDAGQKRVFGRSRLLKVATSDRLPDDYSLLAGKSVGIVGCGSLGSKLAAMLARAGVRMFTLVDDDVFFAENLVRNELGAAAAGVHKADAVRSRLIEIAGTIDVTVRRVALGGQESADSTDSVMSALRACDLIIDATADAHCFNFCAAVAKESLKPLVWGEVFAGGIGGLVARVRSGHEPEPQAARNQINAWCNAHGVPAPLAGLAAPYEAATGSARPLVADDAEVSIIAGHLARLATDVLTLPEDSAFTAPAYAIGLRKAWIFSQPFETWPIELAGSAPWKAEQDPASVADSLALLRELLPSAFDGHDQPSE
ncbi:ThiF family adenylyltransferase [Gluconacetobacter diazotrophicus]|uniref:Putative Ubiquitin-activating enzyme n=1 Tax=Gluconacetobacter diazotrophicus (strain ATCC 49037 / DSM 5601 / CCUG 37298 / CIP 103539 / LMG 7603 / PAl5) TaxID=272568 RepID=A9H1V9_GLUDA|nr:ThiF family adenylyltransferase [Gluconacetobacter diazotrophicus]CAP54067.1 putative Ubiquitin-activating enzyme [Gluconacetobacter diazotrophicus PA1 5]